jgi:cell division septation protein DedD
VGIRKKADADAQIAKFAAEGIPAYAIPVPTDGAGLAGEYWRVRVGRFTSRAAAQAFSDKRLVPEGMKPWIDRKSNEARADGTP